MNKKIVVAIAGEKGTSADTAKRISRVFGMRKREIRTIVIPVIAIKAIKKRNLGAGRYDWILFTSKNSVDFFVQELCRRLPLSISPMTRIAAVGPETARALKRAGIRVDLMPKEFSAKHIVQALGRVSRPTGGLKGKRILFPRSAIAPFEPVRALRKRGARVTIIHLYTTIPARVPRRLMLPIEKGEADYLVFMSPSGIAGFMKNVRGDGKTADKRKTLQTIRNTPAVCIGPLTATAARRFGFTKIHTAKTHSAEGISDLLGTLA